MQKPPNCRLQQKTSQSGDPEDGTHRPTKLHRGRLSPAVCKGAVGLDSPHGTPKSGKKVLTLWLVRASDLEECSELTREINPRGGGEP